MYLLSFSCLLGFLTAVLQAHAREHCVPVDSLSFSYRVLNEKWTPEELLHGESSFDFKRVAFQVSARLYPFSPKSTQNENFKTSESFRFVKYFKSTAKEVHLHSHKIGFHPQTQKLEPR